MGIAFLAVVSLQSHDGAVTVANMSLAAKTVSAGVVQSCGLAFEALFSSWTRLSLHGVSLYTGESTHRRYGAIWSLFELNSCIVLVSLVSSCCIAHGNSSRLWRRRRVHLEFAEGKVQWRTAQFQRGRHIVKSVYRNNPDFMLVACKV